MTQVDLDLGKYKLGWSDEEDYVYKPRRGLDENLIKEISWMKGEPDWMRDFRLRSYEIFKRKPMPNWGGDMSQIFFDDIFYYIKPTDHQVDAWEELPDSVKGHVREAGYPRGRAKVPRWCHGAVRVRGRLSQESRGSRSAGRAVLRHGHGDP